VRLFARCLDSEKSEEKRTKVINMNENELTTLLKQIVSADKTIEYEYYPRVGESGRYLNANGIAPPVGCRWYTPRELCAEHLRGD